MGAVRRILLAVLVVVLLATGTDAKKKRVKTTFKELKCSSCKAVAGEFGEKIVENWDKNKGNTILIEKRKKKTKVLYQESELSIQEAVDHTCDSEDHFDKFNVTKVGGRPEYTKVEKSVGKKEYKKQLSGMCQTLLAEHEPEIVSFFFKRKEWQSDASLPPRAICVDIAGFCREEDMVPLEEGATSAKTDL